MDKPKFKVGDVCEVFNRGREGSVLRKNFIIGEVVIGRDIEPIYFPIDKKQGAYQSQLRLEKITNWRRRMQDGV